MTTIRTASHPPPQRMARWLVKVPIPWIDQFFVVANLTLVVLVILIVQAYGVGHSVPFAGQSVQRVDPALVLAAFAIYEVVASLFIWWKKPLASGQAGGFLLISLFFALLFYAVTGGIGSIYFYPFIIVVLYAALALKTGAAALFILATAALHTILGRFLIPTTNWDASIAQVAQHESMVLLVLGGVSLFFTAQLRRDAQSYQATQAEARLLALLHQTGRKLAEQDLNLDRMFEIMLDAALRLPQTEFALVTLRELPDLPLRVVASTIAHHPVGELLADLALPSEPETLRGTGTAYQALLPTYFAHDGVRQVILVRLYLPINNMEGAVVFGRQSDQPLTPEERRFVCELAVEAGLAVRYGRVFAQEIEHVERLKRFQELQMTYWLTIAHDMKTPLTVLTTLTPMLRQLPDLPEETRREIVEAIDGNLTRLAWTVNSRLMAAKLDSDLYDLHARPLDLASLIRQVVEQMSSWLTLKRHIVQLEVDPDLPLVWADGSQLEHVISNLLVNAAKFSPVDSTIIVTIAPTTLQGTAKVMQVCVEDEGPGVPSEQRQWIFEKFHAQPAANATGGTGLGLHICRLVVERHGGRIWVEDRPGGGSRFCFTLPLVDDESVDDEGIAAEDASKENAHEEIELQNSGD